MGVILLEQLRECQSEKCVGFEELSQFVDRPFEIANRLLRLSP
jgi:hypothetical protein